MITVIVKTREDMLKLSYYTLCKISDRLMVGSIIGMVSAIERGDWKGLVTLDSLGNFLDLA